MASADDMRSLMNMRRVSAERAVEENRRDPRSGKNAPSRAADARRPVVETRGDRRKT